MNNPDAERPQTDGGLGGFRLRMDMDDAVARYDTLWELANSTSKIGGGRPDHPILEVLCFKTLNLAEGCHLASVHGDEALYRYALIRNGKFVLKPEYSEFEIKDVTERREKRTAWVRWFKKVTGANGGGDDQSSDIEGS